MRHTFVDHIPEQLEPGVLYVSIEFGTAVHSCACGCGFEVVTPLSPAQWSLTYDGQSVSLSPSIGNWSFPCKSHYWVRKGRIEWGTRFSEDKIEAVKARDKADLADMHAKKRPPLEQPASAIAAPTEKVASPKRKTMLSRILDFFG
jgi:hypothetical protein